LKKYIIVTCFLACLLSLKLYAQELYPISLDTTVWHGINRTLRYHPQGTDFVIENGDRLFTRALYGTNTAFRIETGDRPEFALYMPGMGGNMHIGFIVQDKSKWLTQANTIVARYSAGSMHYTIQDSLLGEGKIYLDVIAMSDAEGMILKWNAQAIKDSIQMVIAYGGASGKKFSRDGDMGADPVRNFFVQPENCRDNIFSIEEGHFTLEYGSGEQIGQDGRYFVEDRKQASVLSKAQSLVGTFPVHAICKLGDATQIQTPLSLVLSKVLHAPIATISLLVTNGVNHYFTIHNPATRVGFNNKDVPAIYEQADAVRAQIAQRIQIHTPDPFMNTIGGTLAIASDAIWESPSYMHGSIGWRMRLNGWRGAYTADDLGWHDRARIHLESYAQSQLTDPASGPISADSATHWARSVEKLGVGMFTSGYISRDPLGKSLRAHHYDMNLVYIDILLRHYAWTGDTIFLKKTWPNLQRHLAWEKRNFDVDGDGLYDAYAAIWASDALQYSGGGVTHSSAYNYYANKKAAEIAILINEDPLPYQKEADKILAAMNKQLWMPTKGTFAEYKDLLGNQLLHPAAALWTIYHSMDEATLNPFQAYLSMRYVDHQLPHIPIRAKGLEEEGYYTISTSNWMPYTWSLNNVALAETMHMSLANWQAGRTDEAFKLFKSEVLQSMYLGGSPGNIVQISYYDATRGETYRDFADPIGMCSRALVEGLFGIVPDALHDTLTIRPGLPSNWPYASFSTPDIKFDFKRNEREDTYTLVPDFPKKMHLKLQVNAQGQVRAIKVNGQSFAWKNIQEAVGKPVIELNIPSAAAYTIQIQWSGKQPVLPKPEKKYVQGDLINEFMEGAQVLSIYDPQSALAAIKINETGFTAKANQSKGEYTVFAHMQQGGLNWWMPICFKMVPPISVVSENEHAINTNQCILQNNTSKEVHAILQVNQFQLGVAIPAQQKSNTIIIPLSALLPGTNRVQVKWGEDKHTEENLIQWNATLSTALASKLENISLVPFFNDKVTQIFNNKYLSPRPVATTLQLPWQGIGDWPHPLEKPLIEDNGLRKLAATSNHFSVPQGISFATPGKEGDNNILFTSQWDNYPKQIQIPLNGKAAHAWLLMAGSTNPMQSQLDNGVVIVEYENGTADSLLLRNPETWWPIEKDYYTDGFAFKLTQPRPLRVHLKTGNIISSDQSLAKWNGKEISGGAATILDLPLDPQKKLKQFVLKTIANDVVIGLMGLTLLR